MSVSIKIENNNQNFEESFYVASQWQLMWRKFKKHKLALFGTIILSIFYFFATFCEFISPDIVKTRNAKYLFAPPQMIHFFHKGKFNLRPFVYGYDVKRDKVTWSKIYKGLNI